jgi:prefoldin subunit 5
VAKTVTLTVKVDDTDFKRFIANFNAFSSQIKNLNQQFNQINTTIQKTTSSSNALISTMKSLWQTTKSLSSTVASITTHFIKWSALIGGIGAMLGMGGGLFGIDRLAASILQKRRLVLGLGGDFGRTQAAQIFGQGMLEDPTGVLQNIAKGKGGSPEQLRGLISLGIPFGTKMTPEEILPKIIETLRQRMRGTLPGTELITGKQFGAEALGFSDADILRISRMKTSKETEELAKLIVQRGKEMTLSEKAQKAWSDLAQQFQAFKTSIQSLFGEKLADLSKPLSELSKSIVKLVTTLLNMPIVEKMIKQLTTWLDRLSKYLASNRLEKDLKEFSKTVEGWVPLLREFKDALLGFVETTRRVGDIMGKVWSFMKTIWKYSPAGMLWKGVTGLPGLFGGGQPTIGPTGAPGTTVVPGQNIIVPGASAPGAGTIVVPGGAGTPAVPGLFPRISPSIRPLQINPTPGPLGFLGGTNQFANMAIGGGSQFMGGAGGNNLAISGGGVGSNLAFAGGVVGGSNVFTGGGVGGNLALMGGGRGGNLALMGGNSLGAMFVGGTGGGGGADKLGAWGRATGGMVPGAEGRSTWAGLFGFYGTGAGGGGGGGGRGGGPLDANNWQSNRTASIVIRNTPGSNPYMTATGMAG